MEQLIELFPHILPVTSDYNSNFETSVVGQEDMDMTHDADLVNAPQRDIHLVEEQAVDLRADGLKVRIIKKLGSGAYGSVYKGILYGEPFGETKVAVVIKVEHYLCELPQINLEQRFYTHLNVYSQRNVNLKEGIPIVYYCGQEVKLKYTSPKLHGHNSTMIGLFNIIIMEELGKDLKVVHKQLSMGLPFACWIDLAGQMFKIMRTLVEKKLIHRDIKPSNFVLGRARATVTARGPSKLFIVDFGLSKRWERMKREWGLNMVGTKKYMSEHVMAGDRPHVRDDLISCCYVLREMLDGCLPWDEMVHEQDDMRNWHQTLQRMKRSLNGNALFGQEDPDDPLFCFDTPDDPQEGQPNQPDITKMCWIFDHIKGLQWGDLPDFDFIFDLLNEMKNENQSFLKADDPWKEILQVIND